MRALCVKNKKGNFVETIIKTAVGVFLALLLIFVVRIAYVNYVMDEMNKSITKMTKNHQENSLKIIREQQAKKEEKEIQKQLKIIEIARKKELEHNKDQAWFKYYKEPKDCQVYQSDEHMVECTNKRIRAKRKFEVLWSNNEI